MNRDCRSEFNRSARTAGFFLFFFLSLTMIGAAGVSAQDVPTVENRFRPRMRRGPQLEQAAVAGAEGSEEAMLFRPNGMFFDTEGNLYIPDWGNGCVMVYGRDGAFLRRIGSKGAGPGEIQIPAGAYISWAGELIVPDPQNQRTSYFGLDGEFLRSEGQGEDGGMVVIGPANVPTIEGEYLRAGRGGGGVVMMTYSVGEGASGGMPEMPPLVEILNDDGEVVRSFGERIEHEDTHVANLLNRASLAYLPDGRVAVAYDYRPEIEIFDYYTGELVQIVTRETAFRPKDPSIEMKRNASPDGSSVYISLEQDADEITIDAACDPEGRLWVITRILDQEATEAAEENEEWEGMLRLEVFSPEGELLGALPLDGRISDIEFDPAGDLWMLEASETNTAIRYEVIWP